MILVLNCGSQSIKWKIFQLKGNKIEELESEDIRVSNSKQYQKKLKTELEQIKQKYPDIKAVGHRVVHGGGELTKPVKISSRVEKTIKKHSHLAPLHNPYNLLGIQVAKSFFKVVQVAVFDTGFYNTLPKLSYIYPLPEKITKKFGFRRYGFHGISHQYAAKQAAKKIKKPVSELNLISCHLGGGASITAIKSGKPIETSKGFTPLEWLMMMTRSGDIDPGIIVELSKKYSSSKLEEILNNQSGLKGICGEDDMLTILNKIKHKDKKAKFGLEMFCYRIQKYIGAYHAILGKIDALVFTGKIGFGSEKIRKMITGDLKILKETKILSIQPNEELAIANQIIKML